MNSINFNFTTLRRSSGSADKWNITKWQSVEKLMTTKAQPAANTKTTPKQLPQLKGEIK